jgi:hypothetical protein
MPCRSQGDLRTSAKPHPVPTHHLACLGVPAPGQNNYPCIYLASPPTTWPRTWPLWRVSPLRSRRTNAGSRASDPAGWVCSPHGGEPGRCMAGGLDPEPRTSPITHTHHPSPITHTHHPSPITHHPSPITHHPSPITHHPSPTRPLPPTCFRGAGAPVRPSRDHYL